MPIVDCTSTNKTGKKFGELEFCFTGSGAQEKDKQQA